jgi:polyisoprenoid-binding protein YceI
MRRILPYAALALVAVVATPIVLAQGGSAPGAPDKSRVTAGTYAADAGHTMVVWEVDHLGFSKYTGIFGDVTGTLVIDPANLAAAKVDVTIPVSKVTTASAGLTDHLLRAGKDGGKPDFFGAAPADAKFVSTSVVLDDDGDEAKVTGNLTLNGVTKPVTLDVDFHGAGMGMTKKETIGFQAETTIKRSDFGINMGIPYVSDAVELEIHAAFEKQ